MRAVAALHHRPPAGCGRERGRDGKGKEKKGAASATAGRARAESGGAAGLARVGAMRAAARRDGAGCLPASLSVSGKAWWSRGGKQGSRFHPRHELSSLAGPLSEAAGPCGAVMPSLRGCEVPRPTPP